MLGLLVIENEWMEIPPQADNRKGLARISIEKYFELLSSR
jgi:hypothetical protein